MQNPLRYANSVWTLHTELSGRAAAQTNRSAIVRFMMKRFDTECNRDEETKIRTLKKVPSMVVIMLAMVRNTPVVKW